MRTFTFTDAKSNKFWNIDLQGASFTVNFGKIGSKGQTQIKDFPGEEQARSAYEKLVAEKLNKGYVETTPKSSASATPMLQSLEQSLVENPDDLATHAAYADYLMEQGDPRGEFIQVQFALVDPHRAPQERKQFQNREASLLAQYSRQWLGDLGRFLVGKWSGPDKPYHYQFARGWLDLIRTAVAPDAIFASLGQSPEVRLLRQLEVLYDMTYHPFEFDEILEGPNKGLRDDEQENETYEPANIMPPLLASPYLTNLRVFKLGFSDSENRIGYSTMVEPFGDCNSEQILGLLQKCPRLDELYLNTHLGQIDRLFASPLLGNLRVLQYHYGSDYMGDHVGSPYPLSILANNTSLKHLTTLRLLAGRDTTIELDETIALVHSPNLPNLNHLQIAMTTFGDEVCQPLMDSGILHRLKTLDLSYGNLTDAGARQLANCPDLKHLDVFNVTRNALTSQGINALQETCNIVIADEQHDLDDEYFMYEVDYE